MTEERLVEREVSEGTGSVAVDRASRSWDDIFATLPATPHADDLALQQVMERLDRIEGRQQELRAALWAQLLARLDRIEQGQNELRQMILDIERHPEVEPRLAGKALALGSPIDSAPATARSNRARPDMGLPPFARSVPAVAPGPDHSARAVLGSESPSARDVTDHDMAGEVGTEPAAGEALEPLSALDSVPGPLDPATEEAWLHALPTPRRRWFGRRRDRDSVAIGDFPWPQPNGAQNRSTTPPVPPGFVERTTPRPTTNGTDPASAMPKAQTEPATADASVPGPALHPNGKAPSEANGTDPTGVAEAHPADAQV